MTDMANTQLGSFEAHESRRRQNLDGDELLAVSVRELVVSAPTVPAFPKTALASLDPVSSSPPKRPKRVMAWLALLATVAGVGVAIPQFASQESRSNSMLIIKPLPRNLSVVATTERMGGTPYLGRSSFHWTDANGDSVGLSVGLDRAASEKVFKTAGLVMPASQLGEVPFPKNVSLANGIRAALMKAPETNPQFEWLSWTVPGFELALSRTEPRRNALALVTIANQISSTKIDKWLVDPKLPIGYREVSRQLATGEIETTSSEFQAQIADSNNDPYSVSASTDPYLRSGISTDRVIEIAGKSVNVSKNYVSFLDGDLLFYVSRGREKILPRTASQVPLDADPTVIALVTAARSGSLSDWQKQLSKPLSDYEVRETSMYKGLKVRYAVPINKFGDELVCIDQITLGSCRPISMRADPNALALPGGSWLVIGMLRSMTSARGEYDYTDVKSLPASTPDGASFTLDVLPIGVGDRIAVGVLPSSVSHINLENNRGRINRPRPQG